MIKLTGRAEHVSTEQVRAFLCASMIVLAYHKLTPALPLRVKIKKKLSDPKAAGLWINGEIHLLAHLKLEDMLTTCIHEVIHACTDFGDGTDEKCTSTLVSKIKQDVAAIANTLAKNAYRRAAYIAHTKIAYRTKDGKDFYDDSQHHPVGVIPRPYKRGKRTA